MAGNPNPSPATRFKPGNKANPGGKPKGPTLASFLRKGLEEVIDGKPRSQRIAEKLLDMCEDGDRQAIKDVFDRIEGKVPDKLEVETDEKTPEERTIIRDRAREKLGGGFPESPAESPE